VRYYRPLEKEEIHVNVHPETGRVVSFDHQLPEDQPGADITPDAARVLASAFLASRGFDVSRLELKESTSERKKARRDHTLVWEASPGDPRNLDEAHYRIRVQVAGDQIGAIAPFWKLPESYERTRSQRNLLSNMLLFLRIIFIAGGMALALWLIVQRTRKHELRWRNVVKISVPVSVLGVLGSISTAPLFLRRYDTAIPIETFRVMMIAGVAISGVGLFLWLACCAAVLLAVKPDCLTALNGAHRRGVMADTLITVAVGIALAVLASRCEWFLIDRFHANAVVSANSPDNFGAILPAVSATAAAFQGALFGLALLALIWYAVSAVRRRWMIAVVALSAVAALVPGQAHTVRELALHYTIVVLAAGAVFLFARVFARGNPLAYLLVVLTLGLGRRALTLIAQPNSAVRAQGWAVLVVAALVLAWAVMPALSSGRGERGQGIETA
jgi:hypothetical protein